MAQNNRWKGLLVGVAGSVGGLLAMRAYWQYLAPEVNKRLTVAENPQQPSPSRSETDFSLVGKQYQEGESAPAALGRMVYQRMNGREPRAKETKELLGSLVHWSYGLLQGGMYGSIRKGGGPFSGLIYSSGLWLLGDEMVVPLLGLQAGPASSSLADHANRLGAHWAYGLGTGLTAKVLDEIL